MATSSIHKPGWRSRRRSRLSLVERAVPRLGDLSQLEYSSSANEADETLSNLTPSKDLLISEPPVRKAKASKPPKDALTLTDPVPTTEAAPTEDSKKDQAKSTKSLDRDDQKGEVTQPSAKTVVESPSADIDAAAADATPAKDKSTDPAKSLTPLTAVKSEVEPDAKSDAKSETKKNENETAKTDIASQASEKTKPETAGASDVVAALASPALVPAMEGEAEAKPAAATLELDEPEVVDAVEVATSPVLELDWDTLTQSGFIDPRDSGHSLPANMVPIIRALVRQALSDQSSWRDRIILVTSANERASKSAAAINFAFGLTTVDGHHAVLLDADSTDIGAVDQLGGRERIGVTNALADESLSLEDLVIRTDLDRLTLVGSGSPDTELVDHLASRRMLQILRYLTESPETILVIDAPPILISQEAAVLSVVAGQVVLAVEAGRTTADQIEHALQRIGDRHNVSLVLNESSGMSRDVARKPFQRRKLTTGNRRAKQVRRPMPKVAAAIAGVIALGLLVQQIQSIAAPRDAVTKPVPQISVQSVTEAERWPGLTEMALSAWRQMYQ